MRTRAAKPRRKRPSVDAPTCFLCRDPIQREDQPDAYERLVTDEIPSRVEWAHGECAAEAGLPDGEDEEDPRRT